MVENLKEYGLNTTARTYVIAELGINHSGNIEVAKKLIDSAVRAGVDAVKLQTYLTEKRAPKDNQVIFDILKKCELPFSAFKELQEYTKQYSVEFFSTVFDEESLDYLESINMTIYKLASFDVVNQRLLKRVAQTGKPVILSVGMSTLEEIQQAVAILREGTNQITLLHCISSYPTREEDANLQAINTLQEHFDCLIGQSDHTNDIRIPLYAVASGAQVIEKHFKIDEAMVCIDAPVSITEEQMRTMIKEIRRLELIMGNGKQGLREAEKGCAVFRRSTVLS
jgi:N,N'-diacetyllegionaminate synthase